MTKRVASVLVVGPNFDRVRAVARALEAGGFRASVGKRNEKAGAHELVVCALRAEDQVADVAAMAPAGADVLAVIEGTSAPIEGDPAGGGACWFAAPRTDDELRAAVAAALRGVRERRAAGDLAAQAGRLLGGAPIGVFELDGERITYANAYLASASGYEADDLRRMSVSDLVAPEDARRLAKALSERATGIPAVKPSTYRLVGKDGEEREFEIISRRGSSESGALVEGTAREVTAEIRLARLHRTVLELGEIILGEQDVDRILQLVLDTITEYSGFRRSVLTLYDVSAPSPVDGAVTKTLCSGLSPEEKAALYRQPGLSPEQRHLAFADEFRLGPAYYVPHDVAPWAQQIGITGTVSVQGWHPDDMLFIPLRATSGIVGSISVDDPVDQSAPTLDTIEPIAHLASFAALAIERVVKLGELRAQNERLHSLSRFGEQIAQLQSPEELCEAAARRVCDDMAYDYASVWLRDGDALTLSGVVAGRAIRRDAVETPGARKALDGDGVVRWAVRYMEPVVVDDVTKDERCRGSRAPIRSLAVLPLRGRKGIRGALNVESERLAAFGDQDLVALSAVASQLSIALAALDRREALSHVYAFGQRISESTDVGQIIAGTLDFLAEQFSYPLASIFRQTRDGRLMVVGLRGPYSEAGVQEGWTLPLDRGVVSWVARNRRFALVHDVSADPRYFETFLGLRSEIAVPMLYGGRLVGVLNVESPQASFFDDEDRVLLEVIANHLATALANFDSQESLREQTVRDPLTGLFNRHYFNSIIAPELSRSDRYARPFTMMMIDVDNFRAVNNRYGHLAGDEVLQAVSRLLIDQVRSSDRVIRYGGDEFLVFMPETAEDEASLVAARLREHMAHLPRKTGVGDVAMGLSIGIYTRRPREKWSLEAILEEADRRLYADKRARHVERADDYRG